MLQPVLQKSWHILLALIVFLSVMLFSFGFLYALYWLVGWFVGKS